MFTYASIFRGLNSSGAFSHLFPHVLSKLHDFRSQGLFIFILSFR